jgi:hypothetical protein
MDLDTLFCVPIFGKSKQSFKWDPLGKKIYQIRTGIVMVFFSGKHIDFHILIEFPQCFGKDGAGYTIPDDNNAHMSSLASTAHAIF